MIDWLIDTSFKYGQRQLVMENRPFPSPPRPPYQNEVKCSAFDMEMIFHCHASKTVFHKKGVHLASFWKWGFLELGSGLFSRGLELIRKTKNFEWIMITYVRPDKESIKVLKPSTYNNSFYINKETTNYFSHCTSCPCNSLLFPRASSVTLVTLSQNSTTFFLSKPCLCSSP